MTQAPGSGAEPRKLLAGGAIRTRIAVGSALVLSLGAWLAPRAAQTALSAPQERAAPLLEAQVQLREASPPFVGVQDVADRVRQYSVAIPVPEPTSTPTRNDFFEPEDSGGGVAGFGAFVAATYLLAHSAALDGRSVVEVSTSDGRILEARVAVYEPSTGLVLLETPPSGARSVPMATGAVAPGALAVAVGRWGGRDLAIPAFVTAVGGGWYTLGSLDDSVLWGMPVYTLDGALLAVAASEGREVRAFPAKEAADRLIARALSGERLSSFGLSFQELTDRLAPAFGSEGVVITEVIPAGPADRAGVQVGDVLLAVGETPIDSADSATRALGSSEVGTATSLRLRRSGRARAIDVTAALAYEVAALARASRADLPVAFDARSLFAAPVLDSADIPGTARVLSFNGRPVTSRAQVQRELRVARTPVPVLLQQGDRRFFVVVQPTR